MGMWDGMSGGDSLKGMGSASNFNMGDEDIFAMLKQFGGEGTGQMNMTGIPGANPSGGSGNPSAWARGGNAPRSPMSQMRGAGGMGGMGGGGITQLIRILQMLLGQQGGGQPPQQGY